MKNISCLDEPKQIKYLEFGMFYSNDNYLLCGQRIDCTFEWKE